MPLAKQVCREKIEGDESAKGGESEPESSNSNSFHSNSADSFMCGDDEDKNDGVQEMCTSDEPSTSSASWAGTRVGEPEPLSMNEHQDRPDEQCGKHVMEFGHAEIQHYTDKELEELLYSNGVGPGGSGFILSSGRWSVDQGKLD